MQTNKGPRIISSFFWGTRNCGIHVVNAGHSTKLMKVPLILAWLLIAILLGSLQAEAQSVYCIRAGATGANNGSDWNNAFTSIPNTLVRGATYFFASGEYGAHTFQPLAGTSYVYLKKATVSNHGADTGWNDSYANGQAVFSASGTVWDLRMSYLDVDGVTGFGKTGHGIRINSSATTDGSGAIVVPYGAVSSHNWFRHIELNNGPWGNSNGSRVYHNGSSTCTDNNFQYCYFHGGRVWLAFYAGGSSGLLVEYCYFKDAGSDDPALHCAGITLADFSNATIRHSVFENMMGRANTTYIEPQFTSSDINIYGNVFWGTSSSESTGQGIFAITSTDRCVDCYIYNNTIVGLHNFSGIWCGNTSGQRIYVDNNLWQANQVSPSIIGQNGGTCIVGPKNVLNGGASFVSESGGDFRLTAPTLAGSTLASTYNTDPDGVVRGQDGVWDSGAFEFRPKPASPSKLRVITQ